MATSITAQALLLFEALETAERCRRKPSNELLLEAGLRRTSALASIHAAVLAEDSGAFRESYLHLAEHIANVFEQAKEAVGDSMLREMRIRTEEFLGINAEPSEIEMDESFLTELVNWETSPSSSFLDCVLEDLVLDDDKAEQFFVAPQTLRHVKHDFVAVNSRELKDKENHTKQPPDAPSRWPVPVDSKTQAIDIQAFGIAPNQPATSRGKVEGIGHWRPGQKRARNHSPSIPANTRPVAASDEDDVPDGFSSARERLAMDEAKKNGTVYKKPEKNEKTGAMNKIGKAVLGNRGRSQPEKTGSDIQKDPDKELPEIPNIEPRLIELILNEALEESPGVDWEDIAGLQFAKKCVMEAVIWPMQRPDIFRGLRGPPKGFLLFGPPGTGKTMIGRAIASKSGARFFNISSSSLTSKWIGEGEKTVRALFAVARLYQPAVIFIDEIDSLLTQRTESDQEASRRLKTEFLVQMDGAGTSKDDRILVVGATNRPQELDEAARRRLVKRLYIPLPDEDARISLIRRLLSDQANSLSDADFTVTKELTAGYSGSDVYALCGEAALGPVRDLGVALESIAVDAVRPISLADFRSAARLVRASVCEQELAAYLAWNELYGSFAAEE